MYIANRRSGAKRGDVEGKIRFQILLLVADLF